MPLAHSFLIIQRFWVLFKSEAKNKVKTTFKLQFWILYRLSVHLSCINIR